MENRDQKNFGAKTKTCSEQGEATRGGAPKYVGRTTGGLQKLNHYRASTAWKIFKIFLGFGAEPQAGSGAAAPVVGPAGPIFLKLGVFRQSISSQ